MSKRSSIVSTPITVVAPAEMVALTGQYLVADSSMLRRMAASPMSVPQTSCVTVASVRICGYSSRWFAQPWTS